MVSKSQIKLITSLKQKKFRVKEGLFIAEGPKVISELRNEGFKMHALFSTEAEEDHTNQIYRISALELQKISTLKSANSSVAIFEIPHQIEGPSEGLILALDAIRDPGNLGTIIRLCDWFGVSQLVCSLDTVDCYNPKVVQSTMGSIARIGINYVDLPEYLGKSALPIYGGVLGGEDVYSEVLPKQAILVIGNESNGISKEIAGFLTHKVTIPQFGKEQKTESLNAATATAILLSEFNRSIER